MKISIMLPGDCLLTDEVKLHSRTVSHVFYSQYTMYHRNVINVRCTSNNGNNKSMLIDTTE